MSEFDFYRMVLLADQVQHLGEWEDEVAIAREAATALREAATDIERLTAALKPFADYAEVLGRIGALHLGGTLYGVTENGKLAQIDAKDFLRARAAISR